MEWTRDVLEYVVAELVERACERISVCEYNVS